MSNLQSAFIIIMGEVSIILAAILGYLVYRSLRKHNSVMSALSHLTRKIHGNKDDRLNMLQEFLTQTCRYKQEDAGTMAKDLLEKERLFYKSLMETYATHDHDTLKNLDHKTEEIIGAYRNLVSESVRVIADEAELSLENRRKQLSSTIDDLSEKNEQLTDELQQLKHEMDLTVEEYSSAFRNKSGQKDGPDGEEEQNNNPAESSESDTDVATQGAANEDAGTTPEESITIEANDNTVDETETTTDIAQDTAPISADSNQASEDVMAEDDAIEPEFENHGIDEPAATDTPLAASQADGLDEDIKADLEALTAQFDEEQENEEGDSTISLEGLIDDEEEQQSTQGKAAQR